MMRWRLGVWLAAGVALALPVLGQAADPDRENVPDWERYMPEVPPFVETVLSRDDAVKRATAELRAAEQQIEEARGAWNPSVDLSAQHGYQSKKNDAINGGSQALFGDEEMESYRSGRLRLQMTQGLYLGGGRTAAMDQALARRKQAAHELRRVRGERILKILEAYWRMQADRERVTITRSARERLDSLLAAVQSRVEQGHTSAPVVRRVERRMLTVRAAYKDAQGSYRVARSRFRREAGLDPESIIKQSPMDLDRKPDDVPAPRVVDEDVMLGTPVVAAAQESVSARRAVIAQERSRFRPRVLLDAYVEDQENPGGYDGDSRTSALMLRLEWNLFNGHRDSASLERAREKYNAALASARETRREQRSVIDVAYSELQRLKEIELDAERSAELSDSVVNGYLRLFEQGRRSPVAVADVVMEQMQARQRHLRIATQRHLQRYRYLYEIGLLSGFGDPVDQEYMTGD